MSMSKEAARLVMRTGQFAGACSSFTRTKNLPQINLVRMVSHLTFKNIKIINTPFQKRVDLPIKPKKPAVPWCRFVIDRKADIIRQNGKLSAPELTKILSKEWKTFDKTKYKQDYEESLHEYNRQLKDYESSLTPNHLEYHNFKKYEKLQQKAIKELRKTNIPSLPKNSANLYLQERFNDDEIKSQVKLRTIGLVSRDIFKEYRKLSQLEKQKYIDLQEADRSKFKRDFLDWYSNVQNNTKLSKHAQKLSFSIYERFKSLNYI